MKIFKIYPLILSALFLIVVTSCNEDDRDITFVDGIVAPSNLALDVQITQDNTGLVTLTPTGDSVNTFTIDFGDESENQTLVPGESVQNTYSEGTYSATLTGTNLNGDSASITQDVVVSFLPPENLIITITPVSGDALSITVSATADLATGFEVYFGEDDNQEPVPLMVDGTVQHTYGDVGTYTVTVVALAGGADTLEGTQDVIIENPITLPIDFESTSIEYAFADFGGATATLVDNPDASGNNTSANVAQFFKDDGAEIWAGTTIELGAPIDFLDFQGFSLNSYSPIAGATVKLKLENAADNTISTEIDALTTIANGWETLQFDFSGEDLTQEYSKVIVFYDFGNPGAATTFYFDDIEQISVSTTGGGDDLMLPIDFESETIEYTYVNFGGAVGTLIDNPDASGINTSAKVSQFFKEDGSEVWAGTFLQVAAPIDFSDSEVVKIKTWVPAAGLTVRLKLENATDTAIFAELDATTTAANTWEELSFDFSGLTGQEYSKVVVFFDFGNAGDGSTFYFDDIELGN